MTQRHRLNRGLAKLNPTPRHAYEFVLKINDAPGLGFVPDTDWLKGHRFAGEPWWE